MSMRRAQPSGFHQTEYPQRPVAPTGNLAADARELASQAAALRDVKAQTEKQNKEMLASMRAMEAQMETYKQGFEELRLKVNKVAESVKALSIQRNNTLDRLRRADEGIAGLKEDQKREEMIDQQQQELIAYNQEKETFRTNQRKAKDHMHEDVLEDILELLRDIRPSLKIEVDKKPEQEFTSAPPLVSVRDEKM